MHDPSTKSWFSWLVSMYDQWEVVRRSWKQPRRPIEKLTVLGKPVSQSGWNGFKKRRKRVSCAIGGMHGSANLYTKLAPFYVQTRTNKFVRNNFRTLLYWLSPAALCPLQVYKIDLPSLCTHTHLQTYSPTPMLTHTHTSSTLCFPNKSLIRKRPRGVCVCVCYHTVLKDAPLPNCQH